MGQDCLDRRTLSALAAGRCPRKELLAVQRHLPTCARCRAAVVASAAGVRGPGDTVLLTRPGRPQSSPARTALKVASVAVSLLVVGGAWFYGSAPAEAPPPSATSLPQPAGATSSPHVAPPTPAPSSDPSPSERWASDTSAPETSASGTREIAAALQPAEPVPQVQARLLLEPASAASPTPLGALAPSPAAPAVAPSPAGAAEPSLAAGPITDKTPAPASAAPAEPPPADAARPTPRPRRPAAKKPARPSSRAKTDDLPTTGEGEGTDRFGLEW